MKQNNKKIIATVLGGALLFSSSLMAQECSTTTNDFSATSQVEQSPNDPNRCRVTVQMLSGKLDISKTSVVKFAYDCSAELTDTGQPTDEGPCGGGGGPDTPLWQKGNKSKVLSVNTQFGNAVNPIWFEFMSESGSCKTADAPMLTKAGHNQIDACYIKDGAFMPDLGPKEPDVVGTQKSCVNSKHDTVNASALITNNPNLDGCAIEVVAFDTANCEGSLGHVVEGIPLPAEAVYKGTQFVTRCAENFNITVIGGGGSAQALLGEVTTTTTTTTTTDSTTTTGHITDGRYYHYEFNSGKTQYNWCYDLFTGLWVGLSLCW